MGWGMGDGKREVIESNLGRGMRDAGCGSLTTSHRQPGSGIPASVHR